MDWSDIIKNCAQRRSKWSIAEKINKTLSETKPVKNISKNLQSFLEIGPVQKEVLLSHKPQDHAYEYYNPFGLKEDNLSQRNFQNQLSHPDLSHKSKNVRRVWSRKDSQSTKFQWRPQIFGQLSFRDLWNSKLDGLYALDNVAIMH